MAGRFLNLFKPIARVIPEVKAPERRVRFNEKLFWTGIVLVVYLIMSEVPLYGISRPQEERLSALRIIWASHRGTLMELGIGPIVTAGLILQLLVGSNMIECNMSRPEDRSLFTTASKVFTIILTGVQASVYLISGTLQAAGPVAIMVFLQLMAAGIILLLLDELVQKGWGFGSGISLFIIAGVAQAILWQCFGPPTGLFTNALAYMLGGQATLTEWIVGIGPAYPSLIGFITTIAAFLIIIYMEGVRVELPLSYAGYKGYRSRYPIKLLYVSNLPVIFASALFANIYLFSQLFWSMNEQPSPGRNFWLDLLGQYRWTGEAPNQQLEPVGGLVYYVTAPHSLANALERPDRAIGYMIILIVFCIIFSLTWLEVGGLGPSTVAKQLVDAGMQIPGYRRSGKAVESILKRYIPIVTILGGAIVGLIAAVSDFFGVFGSGMGILLSVGIIYQYYEILMRERAAEMYPAFRRLLGE
ncbi:MAG: preprotein translocase subunit SecY [Candidatus Bathyarchaeota archaeon]|nr:preprotein translocase subunit SecY [Candidatus Bathyarchaeota archaeon]